MKKELYNQIEEYMLDCVKESAHDCSHIYRVLNYAMHIAESETKIDYDILIAASLLHDIGRDGKKKKHNEIGAEMAEKYLGTIDFPKNKIDAVCHAIRYHNNGSYGKQKTLEAEILYDADKLDAIGVMGIARSFIGVGNYNHPMYCIKNNKIDMDENCETDTFVRYYLTHIDKNYDRFYTDTAKSLAAEMRKIDKQFTSVFFNTVNDNQKYSQLIEDKLT